MLLPRWHSGKEFSHQAGDLGSISGQRRSPGEGNGNPLQYSCLETLMDRGAWWATVCGFARVGHDLATKHISSCEELECDQLNLNYSQVNLICKINV